MRSRGPGGWISRIRLVQERPVVAALLATALSLGLIGAVVFITPIHCGPLKALGLKGMLEGCDGAGAVASTRGTTTPFPRITPPNGNPASPYNNPNSGPYNNPYSGPYNNPYSGPYNNPYSGPYGNPQGNPISPSGQYPPFYPPVTHGNSTAALPLNCRLPVFAGGPGSGGFIVFPDGSFVADPNSAVVLPSPTGAAAPQGQQGPGYGPNFVGMTYDTAYTRWLPVPTNWLSQDGKHYAYSLSDGLYMANVATGGQSEFHQGSGWSIVGVENDGVYAANAASGGLWFFPYSGSARQITSTGYWQATTSTAAYGTATSAVPQGVTNTIIRLDLKTGNSVEWFTKQGTQSNVMGFDTKGNTILNVRYVSNGGNEIWVASAPSSAEAIAGYVNTGYYSNGFNSYQTPVTDSHGVWFAGNWSSYGYNVSGVALYVAGSGLYWMSSVGGQLAGGCN